MARLKSFIPLLLLTAAFLWSGRPALAADTAKAADPPYIEAQAAIVTDRAGRVLYEKNERLRMYPASTTKILTALLAVENCGLDDAVTVGPEINLVSINSGRCGLQAGESITMRELIYGMLLRSGNDAAMTIAVTVARKSGSDIPMDNQSALNEFAWMMNQRAGEMGARDSHFINPHGLHDPAHYSTAYDLALITRQAMKDQFLSEVVATTAYTPSSKTPAGNGAEALWVNTNKLLDERSPFYMPEATGVKTGHTREAGYCLVSCAGRKGLRIYAVVLNASQNGVWKDSATLLNYGLTRQPMEQREATPAAPKPRPAAPHLPTRIYYMLALVGAALLLFVAIGFSRFSRPNNPAD